MNTMPGIGLFLFTVGIKIFPGQRPVFEIICPSCTTCVGAVTSSQPDTKEGYSPLQRRHRTTGKGDLRGWCHLSLPSHPGMHALNEIPFLNVTRDTGCRVNRLPESDTLRTCVAKGVGIIRTRLLMRVR